MPPNGAPAAGRPTRLIKRRMPSRTGAASLSWLVGITLLWASANATYSSTLGEASLKSTRPPALVSRRSSRSESNEGDQIVADGVGDERPYPTLGGPSSLQPGPATSTLGIDTDEVIDELASASAGVPGRGIFGEGGSGDENVEVEGVYKSTLLYPAPLTAEQAATTTQILARARSYKKRERHSNSHLQREGASLLQAVASLSSRTTHGICRAVNVTGTAASVVTGGVFKLAGAAVLDAVDGMEYASAKSPTEVPGITEAYRLLTKGLRKTGETVYDFGVVAQNMTVEATEAAEETIRNVVGSVIETASGGSPSERDGPVTRKLDYFATAEDRIIDNMMFGMSYAGEDEQSGTGGRAGGGEGAQARDSDGAMEYFEGDLSTDSAWLLLQEQQQQQGQQQVPALALRQHHDPKDRPKLAALAARVRLAIRRSILRTSRAVPSMRFPQMVACAMVFSCRVVTKNPWVGVASFIGARMYLKFVESVYLECLKDRMMSDIKFEAVARLHEGSPERARWFNTAVSAMWVPQLEPLLSRWASRQIAMGMERSLPSNVSWVGLGKVTLGPRPPTIRYVQVQNVTSLAARKSMGQSNAIIDSVLLEAGQPGAEVNGEHVVYLEIGVDWTSVRSKVSLKLGEQSRRRNWWSVSSYVPSYRVKLCDLGIKAKVVVALAVGEGRPFVKRLWVGFAEPPMTHLSLEALTGMDIANLPVLRKHLRHVVMRCVMPLTEPRHLAIEMKPPASPPASYRGAALAARVAPAGRSVRRGFFSRVPAFGLRRLMRHRAESAAAAAAAAMLEAGDESVGQETMQKELEEATRRLLVSVGGEFREETVLAAAVASVDVDAEQFAPAGASSAEPTGEGEAAPLRPGVEGSRPPSKARASTSSRAEVLDPMPWAQADESMAGQEGQQFSENQVDDEGEPGAEVLVEADVGVSSKRKFQHLHNDVVADEGLWEALAAPGAIEYAASDGAFDDADADTKADTIATGDNTDRHADGARSAPAGGSRSEEVRVRRAEIKRRRALLQEQHRATLPASNEGRVPIPSSLLQWWRKSPDKGKGLRRRLRKGGREERAEMIETVCALSRPPTIERR